MKKKFVIYWDKTYAREHSKVVSESFFTESNGFEPLSISAVSILEIGGATPMDTNHVWVMRVA
jgi:hypothetical protein